MRSCVHSVTQAAAPSTGESHGRADRNTNRARWLSDWIGRLVMCWKCQEPDAVIEDYRGLCGRTADRLSLKGIHLLIEKFEVDKEALASGEAVGQPLSAQDVIEMMGRFFLAIVILSVVILLAIYLHIVSL